MALPWLILILIQEVMITQLISLGLTIQQYTSYHYIQNSFSTLTLIISNSTRTLKETCLWSWKSVVMIISNSIDVLQDLVDHARDTLVIWLDSLSPFCNHRILLLHNTMDVLPRLIGSISIDNHTYAYTHVSIVLILILIILLINKLYVTYKSKSERMRQCHHQHQDPVYTISAFIDEELQFQLQEEKEKEKDESGSAKSESSTTTPTPPPLLNSSSDTLSPASSPSPSDSSNSSSIIHTHIQNSRPYGPYPAAYIPYTDSLSSSSSASRYTPTFFYYEYDDDDDNLSMRDRSDDSEKQPVHALYALLRPASVDMWPTHYTDALYDAIVNGTEIKLAKSIVARDYVYGQIELTEQSISLERLFERQWQGIQWVE